jgi:hypothetical protein
LFAYLVLNYRDGRIVKEPLLNFIRHFASYRLGPVKEIGDAR